MDIRKSAILFLAFFLLSGCNIKPQLQAGPSVSTLMLTPRIVASSYGTQSAVSLYAKANINHLIIKLFLAEVQVATRDVQNIRLDNAVAFTNLAGNSTYQVRCYAYKAAGTAPSDLISLDDANSHTDVTIANDDRPTFANIKVKLIDSSFSAQGSLTIRTVRSTFNRITTALYRVVGGVETLVGATYSISMAPKQISLTNLMANSVYRLKTSLSNTSNSRIATASNDLSTATDNAPTFSDVLLGFSIHTFAGTGTAGFSGDGGAATSAQISAPWGTAFDSVGNLYFCDYGNHRVRKVTTATGIISTVAGNGTGAFSGDSGQATSASLKQPAGVAFDGAGNLYVDDMGNHRIRKVTTAGVITTVAGGGAGGDGVAATSASLNYPDAIALDSAGNLYISDTYSYKIRKVTTATGIITTVAGTGTQGFSGDGGAATSAQIGIPTGLAFDGAGNLYCAEQGNERIRKITTATGIISTVAGNGTTGFSGDGGAATSAALSGAAGITFDSAGNLYIADTYNYRIRKVTTATGIITTVAGTGTAASSGDGGAATSAQLNVPYFPTFDSAGSLYIADNANNRIRILF